MRIAGSPLGQPSLSRRRLGFYCHIFFCHPENNGTGLRRRAAGEGRGGEDDCAKSRGAHAKGRRGQILG